MAALKGYWDPASLFCKQGHRVTGKRDFVQALKLKALSQISREATPELPWGNCRNCFVSLLWFPAWELLHVMSAAKTREKCQPVFLLGQSLFLVLPACTSCMKQRHRKGLLILSMISTLLLLVLSGVAGKPPSKMTYPALFFHPAHWMPPESL